MHIAFPLTFGRFSAIELMSPEELIVIGLLELDSIKIESSTE
jgi:hypothetical protein